jgi:hypothetical protein
MSKNSKIKMVWRLVRSMFSHKFLRKKNILCGLGKKTKECPVNNHMFIHKFIFFIRDIENVIFPKNLCANIVYLNVHVKILFQFFFNILKFVVRQ